MKWLSAGLTFVNFASICGLALGIVASGLSKPVAVVSFVVGLGMAVLAYLKTTDSPARPLVSAPGPIVPPKKSKRARRSGAAQEQALPVRQRNYQSIILWSLVTIFAIFAIRSFCWLLYIDGGELKIQSPNNLGDISLHIAHIRHFASGVALWPDNPIYYASKLRYPAGADLFNGLLLRLDVGLIPGLAWTGLFASAATCFAFYRWGGAFGIAGFLFNGGLVGWQFFRTYRFLDYQGDRTIAWKSIALSMFVTQRGLLYAIPAGLLLLCHWRAKYFQGAAASKPPTKKEDRNLEVAAPWKGLPFWVELSLYASMPLFHIHTFLALTVVLGVFFLLGDGAVRKHVGLVLGSAFLPATFLVWLITDHFHAGSVLKWKPGWVQSASGELAAPFFKFWTWNFGTWIPLVLLLIGLCAWQVWKNRRQPGFTLPASVSFLLPAVALFLLAYFVKLAPWEWDNMKIIIWAYFIPLPFLWSELISRWPIPVRVAVCISLFTSGFVTLFGGLAAKGYDLTQRAELDAVGVILKRFEPNERFAAYPTYNHPLLLQGRKVVLGYPGHLWTQGFDYAKDLEQLVALMNGAPGWQEIARHFHARYLFWGREEKTNYALSKRPWEKESTLVTTGSWGSIYDLAAPSNGAASHRGE